MALNSSRSAVASCAKALQKCSPSSATVSSRQLFPPLRSFSTSQILETEGPDAAAEISQPRWSYTPERMKGPGFSINVTKDPRRKVWSVNEDPKNLDAMYNRL